jgi:hypothetical protein
MMIACASGVQVARAQLQRSPGEERADRGGIRWGGLQGLAGDLVGLVPATQGDQCLGGVAGHQWPEQADLTQVAGRLQQRYDQRGHRPLPGLNALPMTRAFMLVWGW